MSKTKSKTEKPSPEVLAMRRRLSRTFIENNIPMLLLSTVMMVLLSAFNLIVSYLLQQIVDIAAGYELAPLVRVIWQSLAALAGFVVVFQIQRYTIPAFLDRAMRQYKDFAFAEITKKNISSFSGENTGRYISALTNDCTSIRTNYLGKIFVLMMHVVGFAGALGMMIWYSPRLTAAAVVFAVFPMLGTLLCGNKLAEAEKEVSEKNEGFVGMVKDMLSGFAVVKSFKAEKEIRGLFSAENAALEESTRRRAVTGQLIDLLGNCTGIIAQMGVFIYGAYLAVTGEGVTPGVVLIFLQLMNFVISPISAVPPILANRKAALALMDKLAAAIGENAEAGGKQIEPVLREGISVRDLTYGYDEGKPVLRGLSADFRAGRSYAIVGGSGCGKSTLLNLLMRGSDKYEGSICYDGEELRGIDTASLYDLVSLVQQNVFVFDSTIRNNITMFRDFDDAAVADAIERSGLSALIAERGEDYDCGENGSGLSGGEKQRISIARCLLRGTPALLMDEATAALDEATAFAVTGSILDMTGLTRIVVTHRLEDSLMRRYDEIVVLKGGAICERGSFEELMEQRGQFYSLYNVSKN